LKRCAVLEAFKALTLYGLRSGAATPLLLTILIASALIVVLSAASNLARELASSTSLSREGYVLALGHGNVALCKVTICVKQTCFRGLAIAFNSIEKPCLGAALARALGVHSVLVVVGDKAIRVSRICYRPPSVLSYVVLPTTYIRNECASLQASFHRIDVVKSMASDIARELSSDLGTIELVALIGYALIVVATSVAFINEARSVIEVLKFVGLRRVEIEWGIAVHSAVMGVLAALLGVCVGSIAMHVAQALVRSIVGIYMPRPAMPSTSAAALCIAVSAALPSTTMVIYARRLL